MEKYVCIHGHFYQPPRENPWLEEVELQDEAYPYHDWNKRITAECYAQNAASRILVEDRKIIDIVNNYIKISSDFGPTLMSWLQRHEPAVYKSIQEADKRSRDLFSGHGAAMAQAYNHMIMPLANERDKRTQVAWGMADFEHRFGRRPEGMWLPETAVDYATLEVLVDYGIHFTVLAPMQAKAIRPAGHHDWVSVDEKHLDTTQAYRCPLPSGRSIDLFFYQGDTAQNVAFGQFIKNGEVFAKELLKGLDDNRPGPGLAHIATDGETYGHHFRHADMALAYCLHHIESNHLARVTVYGEYLEKFPPAQEVQIHENTSWSCAHGVERWRSNCGCFHGRYPAGKQAYRRFLREAMDWLRDQLIPIYEQGMQPYTQDPWAVRDRYINLINNRSRDHTERFLADVTVNPLTQADKTRILKLLESQRHAMLMYTSCGWFFDDIAGIESVQIMQYAARAIQLAREVSGADLEAGYEAILEQAPCNSREYQNGREVYHRLVKVCSVDLNRVGAHLAMSSLFAGDPEKKNLYCYDTSIESYNRHETGPQILATGRAAITSTTVLESYALDFAVIHQGDYNLVCAVNARLEDAVFQSMHVRLKEAFDRGDSTRMMRVLNDVFNDNTYSLFHLFRDEQRHLLNRLMEGTWQEISATFRRIYKHNYPVMKLMRSVNMPLPEALTGPAEFILNQEIQKIIHSDRLDADRLKDLMLEATRLSLHVDEEVIRYHGVRRINHLMDKLKVKSSNLRLLEAVKSILSALLEVTETLDLQHAQNILFRLSKTTYQTKKRHAASGDEKAVRWTGLFEEVARHLGVVVE